MQARNVVASHSMKTLLSIVGIVAAISLIWLVPTLGAMQQAASHMHATLDEVASHYVSVGKEHAAAFVAIAGAEQDDAEDIAAAFSAVESAMSPSQKHSAVAELQRKLGVFFDPQRQHASELKADAHFIALNTEVTGRGKASALVLEFNKAALVAREQSDTLFGKIVGGMFLGTKPELLWIDGTPDAAPMHL